MKRLFAIPRHVAIPTLLAAVLAVVASQVYAGDKVLSDQTGNSIRLKDAPCTSTAGTLATIPVGVRPNMKAATLHWQGKDYAACWMLRDERTVFVFDESGDSGLLYRHAFKEDVGA